MGPSPDWYSAEIQEHSGYLIKSLYNLCGKELVPVELLAKDPEAATKALFFADRVILSHGLQQDPNGPILNYGNSKALERWKATWEQLTTMPSRFTAEMMERQAREEFMQTVLRNGMIDDYSGVRIGLDKSRFRIKNAIVWNVVIEGVLLGQAATFANWEELDS
jgi:hypothetical protein